MNFSFSSSTVELEASSGLSDILNTNKYRENSILHFETSTLRRKHYLQLNRVLLDFRLFYEKYRQAFVNRG